jgi:hypothetical protein
MDPITAIASTVGTILDKIFPDAGERDKAKARLAELQINGELSAAADAVKIQIEQISVNREDAKSDSWFQRNWRPGCGWIGVVALGYASVIEPLARFIASVGFGYAGEFPVLDTTITMQVLFGILGLGAYRSFDKKAK